MKRRLSISAAPFVLVVDINGVERSSDHKTKETGLRAWERAIRQGAFSARLSHIDVVTLKRTVIADHDSE
jgi:hypothetical protein